jgi:DNA-binding GntR family transcriptional regulator
MNASLALPGESDQTRLSDAVYEALLKAILSGELSPGAVVSEVALAKRLAVSRTPVHDALRQLAKDGLIVQEANRRAVIVTLTREDLTDIFDMRKLLEAEAARRAATRMDRPTLQRLRGVAETLAATRQRPDWIPRWIDFDEEFHDAIARTSGSPRLWADIARYRLLHRGINKLAGSVEVLEQALKEHQAILDGLEERDGERAARAMLVHITEWQAYFVNHLPAGSRKAQDATTK